MESKLEELKWKQQSTPDIEEWIKITQQAIDKLNSYEQDTDENHTELSKLLNEVINLITDHCEEFTKEIELIKSTGHLR